MGKACSTPENIRCTHHLEELFVYERIILKLILDKYEVWTRFK